MPKILLVLLCLFLSGQLKAQFGFGVFAGAHGGLYRTAVPNYDNIYKDDIIPVGFHAGVGYDWFYVVGKYRSFQAEGTPDFQGPNIVSSNLTAEWKQTMKFVGVRIYNYRNFFNPFLEVGYCMIATNEVIDVGNPSYDNLDQNNQIDASGLGVTAGLEKKIIDYLSVNVQLEWTAATYKEGNNGLAGDEPPMGGVFLGVGLNARFSK